MDGWMIAPTVGYVAALVVAMPLSDMAKVADPSSSNGHRVKVLTWIDWNASVSNGVPITIGRMR